MDRLVEVEVDDEVDGLVVVVDVRSEVVVVDVGSEVADVVAVDLVGPVVVAGGAGDVLDRTVGAVDLLDAEALVTGSGPAAAVALGEGGFVEFAETALDAPVPVVVATPADPPP